MLYYQIKQGNQIDVEVFKRNWFSDRDEGGFDWDKTTEREMFWRDVIDLKWFNILEEEYPNGIFGDKKGKDKSNNPLNVRLPVIL